MSQLLVRAARSLVMLLTVSFIAGCLSSPGAKDVFPKPETPSPTATAQNARVKLSWPAVTNASEYLIYWSTTPGGTRSASNPIASTEPYFEHQSLDNGQTYYYAVVAKGKCCNSDMSAEVDATPQAPPSAPRNVRAVVTGGVATVTWDAVPTADRYTVYVVNDEVSAVAMVSLSAEVKRYETSTTAFAFGAVDDAKKYSFTITGGNVGGEGDGSEVATVTPVTVAIASGGYHSCAVKPDRGLECWGANTSGQLGQGDNHWRPFPANVGAEHNWRRVTAGDNHTCAINVDGTLFCWGQNYDGQLGRPDKNYTTSPSQVGVETDWLSVSAGGKHTCAVKVDHTLWCWGNNDHGQLALGEVGNGVNEPVLVDLGAVWSMVSAGENHTCAVKLDGELQCWGDNTSGQLGVGESSDNTGPVQVGEERQWTAVAAGGKHSCALKSDTSLWCWGRNAFGQLGNGKSGAFFATPQRVGAELGWALVELGKEHSCATRVDGRLWCWGSNEAGQLGLDDPDNQNSPVETSTANSWYSAALGDIHTCALFADGRFACWGDDQKGQLGKGTESTVPLPVSVSPAGDWLSIFAGWYHVCAIKTDFSLWCWGGSGQQGITPTLAGVGKPSGPGWKSVAMAHFRACALRADDTIRCTSMNYGFIPKFFGAQQFGASADRWRQVAISDAKTCALRQDRTIWCWGTAYDDQAPAFDMNTDWEAIAVTPNGLCAIKVDGSRWCQQNNTGDLVVTDTVQDWKTLTVDGRCGIKFNNTLQCSVGTDFSETDVWTKLSSNTTNICAVRNDGSLWCSGARFGTENNWTDISVSDNSPPDTPFAFGDSYYCGLKLNRTLWCWGYTRYGQLANAMISSSSSPVTVLNAGAARVVSAGAYHTCAVAVNDASDLNQRLYCWGENGYGQLGINSTTKASTPTAVDPASRWSTVASGAYHTCGTKVSGPTTIGTLWCWGANTYGQLGFSDPDSKLVPALVNSDEDWISVSAGDNHTCALKSGGALWCWGYNSYGQVGVGNREIQVAPAQIESATQWKSVATGGHHTCATTSAGLLRCWGENKMGQLGTGDTDDRLVPTAPQEDIVTVWTSVATGSKHTCAVTGSDLWCWGDNSIGQLADGTESATRRLTPKKSNSSVSKVAAGGQHTCMTYIDQYGVWCAGNNGSGQLGDGTTSPKLAPSKCNIGEKNWISNPLEITVSAGGKHTCATREDGTLLCWGDNSYGQVGSGK